MEKKVIEKINELYKNELDSHNLKITNKNEDINCFFKINGLLNENKQFNNFKEKEMIKKNSHKKSYRKEKNNNNLFEFKETYETSYKYNNIDNIKEEEIKNMKFNKRKSSKIKIYRTIKDCSENINKAKILLFNKNNNKQSLISGKRLNNKNSLSCNKRDILLISQSSKRNKKFLENELQDKFENINYNKRKKSNNIDYYNEKNENNKDNNEKYNFISNQFKKYSNKKLEKKHISTNRNKRKNMCFTTNTDIKKNKIDIRKYNNIESKKIIFDSDNEVENSILNLLEIPLKNKKINVTNIRKRKHYGTQEILNDKIVQCLQKSRGLKENKSIEIGKLSDFNSISTIKKKDSNLYNLNLKNNEESNICMNFKENMHLFKNIKVQNIVSFEYNDKNYLNKYNKNNNNDKFSKNKKKKFIIYDNNHFIETQKEENNLEDNNKEINHFYIIDNINKKNMDVYNNKNLKSNCLGSLFKCFFLVE